jgi:hypothetical protein
MWHCAVLWVGTDISREQTAPSCRVEPYKFRNRLDTIGKTLDLSRDPVFSGEQNCTINEQVPT